MPTLICPRCALRLTVSDWAPTVLTCPDCLGRIPNPQGRPPHSMGALPPPPLRVIPLEQQAQGDARVTSFILFALAALLGIAAWLSFNLPALGTVRYALIPVCALVLVTAVLQVMYPESEAIRAASGVAGALGRGVLLAILILFGMVLLLLGTCALVIGGTSMLG